MADDVNLQKGIADLGEYLPTEIIGRYQRTSFTSPSSLTQSVQSFIRDGTAGFSINFYAEFLDQGTRFITGQEFITPVITDENGMIEEILTNAFEIDIDESIQEAAQEGGATIT